MLKSLFGGSNKAPVGNAAPGGANAPNAAAAASNGGVNSNTGNSNKPLNVSGSNNGSNNRVATNNVPPFKPLNSAVNNANKINVSSVNNTAGGNSSSLKELNKLAQAITINNNRSKPNGTNIAMNVSPNQSLNNTNAQTTNTNTMNTNAITNNRRNNKNNRARASPGVKLGSVKVYLGDMKIGDMAKGSWNYFFEFVAKYAEGRFAFGGQSLFRSKKLDKHVTAYVLLQIARTMFYNSNDKVKKFFDALRKGEPGKVSYKSIPVSLVAVRAKRKRRGQNANNSNSIVNRNMNIKKRNNSAKAPNRPIPNHPIPNNRPKPNNSKNNNQNVLKIGRANNNTRHRANALNFALNRL